MSEAVANGPKVPRYRIVQFAAYVGAVSVPTYQALIMLAWGSLILEPISGLLFGFVTLCAIGAVLGAAAAVAFFVFRWFFNLDSP